ncbi:hypothetical protein Cni_G11724 [Canna indica]|uniref:Uncharacterized protein n=1 Tax=Canna indica TaxID=4628 RepID=A0AAQ3K895_9LILI|nr:hypothetical protein Cni_G11724 [Canna indica]
MGLESEEEEDEEGRVTQSNQELVHLLALKSTTGAHDIQICPREREAQHRRKSGWSLDGRGATENETKTH